MALRPLILVSTVCLLLGTWLRWPTVSEGLPYFYREDEAHHFNRLVNMAKTGTLDPQYFHKPSLHFYLRMPALAAGVAWNRAQGHLESVRDIETADPFGLAGYRFSASHPGIVKWVRGVSLGLSLLMIPLAVLIAGGLGIGTLGMMTAGLITAVSPELIRHASTVGVDTVMSFFALLSVWLAVRLRDRWSTGGLLLCAAACGLAVSSKYNAAPIGALPLIVAWLSGKLTLRTAVIAVLTPIAAFLLASPYILVHPQLFLDHLGYEVWHYAVAGHEGHTGDPGIGQAVFYLRWLGADAIGRPTLAAAAIGFGIMAAQDRRRAAVLLWFPAAFFLLMIAQKVNFTRNMIPVIPFAAIGAAITADWLRRRTSGLPLGILLLAWLLVVAGVMRQAIHYREWEIQGSDSRTAAAEWLRENAGWLGSVAIDGELQFEPGIVGELRASVVPADGTSEDLRAKGFDTLVAGAGIVRGSGAEVLETFAGAAAGQRIVQSPGIQILRLSGEVSPELLRAIREKPEYRIGISSAGRPDRCPRKGSSEGDYCWILGRLAFLEFAASGAAAKGIRLETMSPWPGQEIEVYSANQVKLGVISTPPGAEGVWHTIDLNFPAVPIELGGAYLAAKHVFSPASRGMSEDRRRLSVAIRRVEWINEERSK